MRFTAKKRITYFFICGVFITNLVAYSNEYPYSAEDRTPFSPLVDAYGRILIPKKIDIANLSLEGIIYSKNDPVAAINGEILGEGGQIGEFKILKIEPKAVILEKGGKQHILKLEEQE